MAVLSGGTTKKPNKRLAPLVLQLTLMNEPTPSPPASQPQKNEARTAKKSSSEKLLARVKSYAWRLTALYVWLKILFVFFGFYTALSQIESSIGGQIIGSLSSVGFAPVNTALLSTILKIGWVLAITGFKLFEAGGLFLYILTFPVWVPIVSLFKFFTKNQDDEASKPTQTERGLLQTKRAPSRLFAMCASLLLGWFLLYGNANTTRQLVPGVVLAGAFLTLLTYRMFLRVKPEKDVNVDVPPFGWLAKISQVAADAQRQRLKKEYKSKSDVQTDKWVIDFTRRLFVRITFLLRGQIAQKRISLYVLGEYLFSLIMVAASAILFWALMLKATYATSLSLLTCIHFSVAHFLPGLQPPQVGSSLPLWASIAPAATAWVLFVLCIGPASSMLPGRQRATINGLTRVHKLYRTSVNSLAVEKASLRKTEKALKP